jgi:MerR family transcriptional regulator, thiopeptide resistance regulator
VSWSTRQLADLAGTTVKAVRHYHEIGLLEEPERLSNGYKQYRTAHLVRLLQIRRLTELGVPLARVAAMGRADEDPDEAIRVLDADIAATIERLQRVRAELAIVLRHRAIVDVPTGFVPVAGDLSATDRALIMVYSRVLDDGAMEDLQDMVGVVDDGDRALDALPADADPDAIRDVARRLLPGVRRAQDAHAWAQEPAARAKVARSSFDRAIGQALTDLYNPAQLKALVLLDELLRAERAERG